MSKRKRSKKKRFYGRRKKIFQKKTKYEKRGGGISKTGWYKLLLFWIARIVNIANRL